MIKLSDTQRVLLAAACQRPDGSVLPLHPSIKPGGGTAKALAALLRNTLAAEREMTEHAAVYRTEGDIRLGLFVTDAGMAAIGVGEGEHADETASTHLPEIVDVEKAPTKIAAVLELLSRPDGAPLDEIIAATGWLPHTIRAAIAGLRKKGHRIQRIKYDGKTCYCLLGAA